MPGVFSYGKEEKLKSRKLVEQLFGKGKSFTLFPLKIIYLVEMGPLDHPVKAGVSAPAKIFRKAVQRNRVKRLLREAYRTEKLPLLEYLNVNGKQVIFFILYVDKTMPVFTTIKNKMAQAMQRLIKEMNDVAVENT